CVAVGTQVQGIFPVPYRQSKYETLLLDSGGLCFPLPKKHHSFLRLLNNKGFKDESMIKGGLDAIGTCTPLESTKSLHGLIKEGVVMVTNPHYRRMMSSVEIRSGGSGASHEWQAPPPLCTGPLTDCSASGRGAPGGVADWETHAALECDNAASAGRLGRHRLRNIQCGPPALCPDSYAPCPLG